MLSNPQQLSSSISLIIKLLHISSIMKRLTPVEDLPRPLPAPEDALLRVCLGELFDFSIWALALFTALSYAAAPAVLLSSCTMTVMSGLLWLYALHSRAKPSSTTLSTAMWVASAASRITAASAACTSRHIS